MKYDNVVRGTFLERPNRFIAMVLIDGNIERCHVKNTGRCKELLIRGATVVLQYFNSVKRSTDYDLIAVYKGDLLINMDSQAPNKVAEESLKDIFGSLDTIKREIRYGNSRFDLYAEKDGRKIFVEVKGVTLENDGICMFPDAPTERGVKHVRGLIEAKSDGYETYVLFIIQMNGMKMFKPNYETHFEFGRALEDAEKSGVGIIARGCVVTEDSLTMGKEVPVILGRP